MAFDVPSWVNLHRNVALISLYSSSTDAPRGGGGGGGGGGLPTAHSADARLQDEQIWRQARAAPWPRSSKRKPRGEGQRIAMLTPSHHPRSEGDEAATTTWSSARPIKPSPTRKACPQVARSGAAVERQLAELGGAPPAPVGGCRGDRLGINPGETIAPPSDATPDATKPGGLAQAPLLAPPAARSRSPEGADAIRARVRSGRAHSGIRTTRRRRSRPASFDVAPLRLAPP